MTDVAHQRRPFVAVVSFMVALTHLARMYPAREKWLMALLEVQLHTTRRVWS